MVRKGTKFKDNPRYILIKSRWHNRERLQREVIALERKLIVRKRPPAKPELTNPTVYIQGRWSSADKLTELVEIQLEITGKFANRDEVHQAALDRLEQIIMQPAEGLTAPSSPGFVTLSTTINKPSKLNIKHFYAPEGQNGLGRNRGGW